MHSRKRLLGGVALLLVAWAGTLEGVRLDTEPRTSRERRADGVLRGASGDNLVSLDFDNVDLKVFIKYVSEITGRNFVVDDKVRGRITLISPTKIRVDELERVLESLLELNGFTAVPSGSVTKIVPLREVKQRGVETDVGTVSPRDRADRSDGHAPRATSLRRYQRSPEHADPAGLQGWKYHRLWAVEHNYPHGFGFQRKPTGQDYPGSRHQGHR